MGVVQPAQSDIFLPDFCGSRRVISVLVICELVAVMLALGGLVAAGSFWWRLFLLSLYLQWIGVCSAAALCLIRQYASHWDGRVVAVLCYLALLAVTYAVSEITYVAGRFSGIAPLVAPLSHTDFLLRHLGLSAIVSALGLRYFWLRAAWLRQAEAEAEARYQALQARIRPHFLFNALNSIASLISVRPADAEAAIEDFSALLRASLGDSRRQVVPFAEELAIARAYARIEALRLGERLHIDWRIDPGLESRPVPPLCLQPLLENAIAHGIAHLPEGGTVQVQARAGDGRLVIEVSNPLPPTAPDSGGFRQALDNIRERLRLRYGQAASMQTNSHGDRFTVVLDMPDNPDEASP